MKKLLFLAPIFYCSVAHATIYQCKTSWGRSTFQSEPCSKTMKQKVIHGNKNTKSYKQKKKPNKAIKSIHGIAALSAAKIYGEYICLAKFKNAEQARQSLAEKFGKIYKDFPTALSKITATFNNNDYLVKKHGFFYSSTSDEIREEIRKRGQEITRDSLQHIGGELREKYGPGILAKRAWKRVIESGKNKAVVDSIRAVGEIEFLKKQPSFSLVKVVANQRIRFQRMKDRARESLGPPIGALPPAPGGGTDLPLPGPEGIYGHRGTVGPQPV